MESSGTAGTIMAVKQWHYGKIILLWVWGAVLAFFLIDVLASVNNFILGFLLIAVIGGSPVVLSIITWRWLSGKEKRDNAG